MKLYINKKNIIIAAISLMVISIFILGIKGAFYSEKIKQASTKQVSLYKEKLIPTLMGDYKDYNLKNLSCNEINPEGQYDYALKIDCNLSIGQDKFNYPVIVLFNNNDENNPKYQYSKEATDAINDNISKKQNADEQEKILKDYIDINRKLLRNDTLAIPDVKITETTPDNSNEKAYIVTSSMIITDHGLGTPKYCPIKMNLQYKNGEYTFKYLDAYEIN